nr:hypothetical protein [Tanacetum cinerariifolium]
MSATKAASEVSLEKEVVAMGSRLNKKRRRRVNDGADANAPPKVFQDSDRKCGYHGSERHALYEKCRVREIDLLLIHSWVTRRLLKKARAQIARRDQRIQVREEEIKKLDQEVQGLQNQTSNLKTLLDAEEDMKKATEAKNADLTKELESHRTQFLDLRVSNDQLTQLVSTLQTQVTGEERIRFAFDEFKKYEDDRVEKRYAEMDARLDALSIDFDEELYPRMLTAIAGRRWVIGHGQSLAVMKCAESIELRQTFANVMSARIPKGMGEGLAHGIEHGKAGRGLELEGLKDAPMEVIMASLHLESDSVKDAPKWIRDLRPSTSQLKIPVYPEVRDPKDPWAIKEEMLLEEAITANVSRIEKKKRYRVVCRTHRVGSAHHARSDGIPVSVPTVVPQGLAILLADAATQQRHPKMMLLQDCLDPSLYRPRIT